MHVTILFSILTALFFEYISNQERNALQNEIQHGLTNVLVPALAEGQPLRVLLDSVISDDALANLHNSFNVTEFYVDEGNTRQKIEAVTIVVLLVAWLGSLVGVVWSLDIRVRFWFLVLENLCTFAFVGVIEFFFFTKVACKFVPVAPSYFLRTLQSSVIKQISLYIAPT